VPVFHFETVKVVYAFFQNCSRTVFITLSVSFRMPVKSAGNNIGVKRGALVNYRQKLSHVFIPSADNQAYPAFSTSLSMRR
jgi:hypothetical protein